MTQRLHEGRKVRRAVGKMWRKKKISRDIKRALPERMAIPSVVHGSEMCSLSSVQGRGKLETSEMTSLSDRGRSSSIRERCSFDLRVAKERRVMCQVVWLGVNGGGL